MYHSTEITFQNGTFHLVSLKLTAKAPENGWLEDEFPVESIFVSGFELKHHISMTGEFGWGSATGMGSQWMEGVHHNPKI